MYALGLGLVEKLRQKSRLSKRLAAGGSDTARSQELLVGVVFRQKLLCGDLSASGKVPGIGVMAVFTSQRTALKEHHEADPGAVNGAEALS